MRIHILTLFIFFAFSPCAGLSETQDKASAPFSVSVNLVKVPISIFNEKGQMITDLRKEDMRVWEDQSLQQIRSFGIDSMPVSVVMLLDTSTSGKKERNKIRDAAREFTRSLSPGDRVSLITFDDQVRLLLDWTEDMNKVRKKLGKLESGLRTALYDAMYLAADEQLKDIEGRKAIILLTDCLNNQSLVGFQEASLKIVQSQASLYVVSKTALVRRDAKKERRVIMLNDIYKKLFGEDENYIDQFFNRKETEMADLVDKTGGRCFFPEDYDQIKDNYSEIAREMKTKYFLTYVSNQDLPPDSFHEISIEYLKPFSKINYRKGYYYLPENPQQPEILRPSFN
jgi:Ca-activated chloride channel family protein